MEVDPSGDVPGSGQPEPPRPIEPDPDHATRYGDDPTYVLKTHSPNVSPIFLPFRHLNDGSLIDSVSVMPHKPQTSCWHGPTAPKPRTIDPCIPR